MADEVHTSGRLTVTVSEGASERRLRFEGWSDGLQPAGFLTSVFAGSVTGREPDGRTLIIDLSHVEFINGTTFGALVKLLSEVHRKGTPLELVVDPHHRWQQIAYSALKAFQTRARGLTPAKSRQAGTRPAVLVRLGDDALRAATLDQLQRAGVIASSAFDGDRVAVAVVDAATAAKSALAVSGARLIFVNASGPDALTGRAAALNPEVFIRRPATSDAIAAAVMKLLAG